MTTAVVLRTPGGRLGRIGLGILGALVLAAVLAPLLAPYDPGLEVAAPFAPPSGSHLLGANDIGQDLLSQLLYGARVSLLIGLLAGTSAALIGTMVGMTAGLRGGLVDATLMRAVDVMLTLPSLPLLIVLTVFVGSGLGTIAVVIGVLMWPRTARLLRAQVLSVREREHVQAARAMGAGSAHLLARHILPAVVPLVIPEVVRAAGAAILFEASLSFLGLGDPSTMSWGSILYYANARSAFLTGAWPWWVVPPGLCIGATVMGLALVGYSLEERARPRLRAGWAPVGDGPKVPAGGTAVAPATDEVLAVDDLVVEYAQPAGAVRALDGVSFSLRRGEVLGVVGESGSGKTTLAAALLRLVKPPGRVVSGTVRLEGRDLGTMSRETLRLVRGGRVALVPQSAMSALNPVLKVGSQLAESILVHQSVTSTAARAGALRLLELVGIPAERIDAYPHELSGGMRQRVVIAMALANEPALVIADEPTTGLDVLVQAEIVGLLASLQERLGLAMLFISHDLATVTRMADRIVVMRHGRIVEEGPATTVMRQPAHEYTRRLLQAVPRLPDPGSGGAAEPADGKLRPGAPLLVIDEVRRSFRGRGRDRTRRVTALDGVSFEVREGESVGLVGASGAGKSTLARLIVGLDRPDDGRILFRGRSVAAATPAARRESGRRIHLVFQDAYDALPPTMRVRDIVAEPCVIQGVGSAEERAGLVGEALAEVALLPVERFLNRYPHELSGGERQRVAFARAIILRPELIVADEPASQLDASLRAELVALMGAIREAHGTAFLFITHDLAVAGNLCRRLVILNHGSVVEEGPVGDVIGNPRDPYTVALMQAARVP